MAISKKKTEEKAVQEAQALAIEVLKAKDFTKEGEDGCSISVDLKINGVTIYGCWYREGKDGKYYNYVYVKLQQSDIEFICKEIEKLL